MEGLSENGGILSTQIGDKKTEKYSKPMDLKNFYLELHDLLVKRGFKDMVGTSDEQKKGDFQGGWAKAGEFIDAKNNRAGDAFEKKFILITKPISKDIEIIWKAFKKTPNSKYGWFEFNLNLSNRFMQDKEFLIGNNKKVLQTGTFELRNSFSYNNNLILKYLNKVPYVKDSPKLKFFYIDYIYKNILEEDIKICKEKFHPLIQNLINKHFT